MSQKSKTPSPGGHNPGAEPLSADELRRDREEYGPDDDGPKLNEKEKPHAGRPDDSGVNWPHKDAFDIGDQLPKAEAENASIDQRRTETAAEAALGKKSRNLETEVGTPGTHDDAADALRRRGRE